MTLRSPSHRYLLGLAGGVVLTFALIWFYVVTFPGAFMEGGYPVWMAKQEFVSHCDLGDAMISGDSRAEAGIDPRRLDIPSRNISFGAETPLEGYFFVRHAMRCARPPRQIVFTYAMPGFTEVSRFLWEDGARFGFISDDELDDISATARALGDPSIENVKSRLGFGGPLRNWLYAAHFPPLYFNALIAGQLFRRSGANHAAYVEAREGLGHIPYDHPALTTPSGAFKVPPVQNAFFERTLALLQGKNVQSVYIPMPLSRSYARRAVPGSDKAFEDYLLNFAKRYPNFHVVLPLVVAWPDEAFLDGIHLKAAYVARFTERFRICQDAALTPAGPIMSCDLSWNSVSVDGMAVR